MVATMRRRSPVLRALALIPLLGPLWPEAAAAGPALTPAEPTHYYYTPAPYVNPPWHLVVSLHELSYAFPYGLQLQASLLDNIGRTNLGAKFGITDNFSIGAGLAHTLVHLGKGGHGIPHQAAPRFGAYLCFGPVINRTFEMALTPHTQIGDRVSAGFDLGMYLKANSYWGVIWEIGSSVDFEDELFYLNTDAGLRIHVPGLEIMHIDLGIDLEEFPPASRGPTVTAYFDLIFGMKTHSN